MKTKNNKNKKHGLILLVVLGMLTLFSLLTVTFVLVSSQSRSTNIAFSRRMVRETETRPLLEESIKQLIRGTTNPESAMWGHDILGDLYGANETFSLEQLQGPIPIGDIVIRDTSGVQLERPLILDAVPGANPPIGRFLRIPLDPNSIRFPAPIAANTRDIDDVLNGRIITFGSGQGPLSGQSFRIVRYIGDGSSANFPPPNPLVASGSQYSITIDLQEADLGSSYSQSTTGSASETYSIAEWAAKAPYHGAHLCYSSAASFSGGYRMFINAVPLNGHGVGIAGNGTSQTHDIANLTIDANLRTVPATLQLRSQQLVDPMIGSLQNPSIGKLVGDTDEPIDAADYNTTFLSYRKSQAQNPSDLIPSFHRAALINYLARVVVPPGAANPNNFWEYYATPEDFWAVIRRIELATLRPLSINIRSANAIPDFMGGGTSYEVHSRFHSSTIPTLTMQIPANWDPIAIPSYGNFVPWLNSLTSGPWDVDNTGDGITDSVWMDLGLPLQRTADGKLLKALVAYYIEDLDGKIDINAAGGTAQASTANVSTSAQLYPSDVSSGGRFNIGNLDASTTARHANMALAQGLGYGSADLSFQHLLSSDDNYANFMRSRYRPSIGSSSWHPGAFDSSRPLDQNQGAPSRLHHLREYPHQLLPNGNVQLRSHRHATLPGMPTGIRGRVSLALDHLGNPLIHNYTDIISVGKNEYESRLISGTHADSPIQLAEWERLYRPADADFYNLPNRLQTLFGIDDNSVIGSQLRHQITMRSRHLLVPKLATRAHPDDPTALLAGPPSFYHWINTIRRLKNKNAADIDPSAFHRLFPLDFLRGAPMNLNRLFGNGLDDDNDGEIDEPSELAGPASFPQQVRFATDSYTLGISGIQVLPLATIPQAKFDQPEPPPLYRGVDRRQLYARQLYCLAQLIVPIDYQFPNLDASYWQSVLKDIRSSPNDMPGTGNAQAIAQYIDIRGRILAQWAVNVVDFRDSDAVMTRFPYDPDPLDILNRGKVKGWYPQRNGNGDVSSPNNPIGPISVVWGLEQPELLLTESLAFHDLRIRQAKSTTGPVTPTRYDQFRIPQGSLFLELYCPRTTAPDPSGNHPTRLPGAPPGLYEETPEGPKLSLAKLSPSDGSNRFPVWRIYIGNPMNQTAGTPSHKTPNQRLLADPPANRNSATKFDLTYQLARSNLVPPQGNSWSDTEPWLEPQVQQIQRFGGLEFDRDIKPPATRIVPANQRLQEPDPEQARVILFTRTAEFSANVNNTPGIANPQAQVFFNRNSGSGPGQDGILLAGNQYLVVGPRRETRLGSLTEAKDANPPLNRPNAHRIDLTSPNWATMYAVDDTAFRTIDLQVRPAVTMVAAAQAPPASAWTAPIPAPFNIQGVGINVSEPLSNQTTFPNGYYKKPSSIVNEDGDFLDIDGYRDHRSGGDPPKEAPFDRGERGPLRLWQQNNDADGAPLRVDMIGDMTPMQDNRTRIVFPGTAIDWCTAYLQRLADPDKPWHAIYNPYLTIDWIPIDLTVFSGEEAESIFLGLDPTKLRLASRQKSGQMIKSEGGALRFKVDSEVGQSFLSSVTHAPRVGEVTSGTTFLSVQIAGDRTLAAGSARPSIASNQQKFLANPNAFATLGFLNSTFELAADTGFSGINEVMRGAPGASAKPGWHVSNLFWTNRPFVNGMELAFVPVSSPGHLGQEFSANPITADTSRYRSAYNNSSTSQPSSPVDGVPNAQTQYPFAHLLNFFQEPPELSWPNVINQANAKDTSLALLFDLVDTPSAWADVERVERPEQFSHPVLAPFQAPNNSLPQQVEPGRINLNTISEPNVLKSLFSQTLSPDQRSAVIDSTDSTWTAFEKSRRGFDDISGPPANLHSNLPTSFAGLFKPLSEAGMVPRIQNDLLDLHVRKNPVHGTVLRSEVLPNNVSKLMEPAPSPWLRDTNPLNSLSVHPFIDLFPMARLQKLVTERSNVFAVYASVGLFEYDEGSNSIGAEFGRETGQTKRMRAFYVIDRSIPVGYRVGQDNNVEKTILIRRVLDE